MQHNSPYSDKTRSSPPWDTRYHVSGLPRDITQPPEAQHNNNNDDNDVLVQRVVTPANLLSLKLSFLASFRLFGYPWSQLPILRYHLIFPSSCLVHLMFYSLSSPHLIDLVAPYPSIPCRPLPPSMDNSCYPLNQCQTNTPKIPSIWALCPILPFHPTNPPLSFRIASTSTVISPSAD